MKKFAIIITALALVLLIGQASFAAGSNAGLTLGYIKGTGSYTLTDNVTGHEDSFSGFNLGLSASYYTQINVSASLKLNLAFGKTDRAVLNGGSFDMDIPFKTFLFNGHAFVRYNVFNGYGVIIAPQVGVILDSERNTNTIGGTDNKRAVLFVAAGLFADVNVTPQIEVYLDAKIPFMYSYSYDQTGSGADGDALVEYFNAFFYDLTVGVSYQIIPNLCLGIEANISNSNGRHMSALLGNGKDLTFSLGGKVSFKF